MSDISCLHELDILVTQPTVSVHWRKMQTCLCRCKTFDPVSFIFTFESSKPA